jgi:hypothetical protein
MRRQGSPASTSKPPAADSMYVALPELPLERTLSRKLFLFLVGSTDQQRGRFGDVSTTEARSGVLFDQLSLDDKAFLVVRQGAGLERDQRRALERVITSTPSGPAHQHLSSRKADLRGDPARGIYRKIGAWRI